MKTSTAVVSGLATLALIGGGTAYALTSAEPTPTETPVASATETPAPSADPSPEPTPAETSAAPIELTAEQQSCRDYVASKWQNEVYPVERERDWTQTASERGVTITWIVDGPEVGIGGSSAQTPYTCTVENGAVVQVLAG